MTILSTAVQRASLVSLLTGLTTYGGRTFNRVSEDQPPLMPNPNEAAVDAWVTCAGQQSQRREGGNYGQVIVWWRWQIHVAVYWVNNPTVMATITDDFVQSVADLLNQHMRIGVDPTVSGNPQIIVSELMGIEDPKLLTFTNGVTFRELIFVVKAEELAQYAALVN